MSRIRSVKPDFWSSEQVMSLSRDERLLFIGMWNFADDLGRIKLNPTSIKAQVLPGDDDATKSVVVSWLSTIIRRSLVECYENAGTVYGQITGWHHQKIDRPQPAKHPGIQDVGSVRRTFDEYTSIVLRTFATDPIGSDGKGEEGKKNAKPSAPPAPVLGLTNGGSVAKPEPKPRNEAFDAVMAVLTEEYRRVFPGSEQRSATGSLVGKLLKLAGGDAEKIRAPLRLFLETPFWSDQGAPLASFVGKYESFERAATKGPTAAGRGRSGRPTMSPATTHEDFADAAPLDEQLKRIGGAT